LKPGLAIDKSLPGRKHHEACQNLCCLYKSLKLREYKKKGHFIIFPEKDNRPEYSGTFLTIRGNVVSYNHSIQETLLEKRFLM
jgi:hypothetical protein